MDAVLNGTAKPVVSDKKRQSSHNEPPVLSRCEDPVASDDDRQAEPCSSPPSLRRETYVTRQRSSDLKNSPTVYRFSLQRGDRSALERRNGATAGFGKLALRLLSKRKKRKQRKQLQRRKHALLGPVIASEGRTTRSRTAASVLSTPASCENSVSSVDVEVTAGTSRTLRPRKSEVNSSAPPVETVKPPKLSPVHLPKEVPVKEKYAPEEIDLVDGIEILGFSSLDDLQKYTEAEEALKVPVHFSDEEIDVEYFSDMEEDPTTSSAVVANTLNSFSMSDSSRMSLFDSSDGEADRSASRNDDWNMRDLVTDEASCSSSKHPMCDRRSKSLDKPEMPKVGQIVDVGLGQQLRPESARNVHYLLDQSGTISRKLAEFSASVVSQKGKQKPKARLLMPVVCSKMLEIMRYRWAVGDHGEQVTLSTAKTKLDGREAGTSAASGSNCPQLKKVLLEAGTTTKGETPKRKAEIPKRRPPKRRKKIGKSTATKVAEDNKSGSDVEVLEIKKVKVAEVDEIEDTAKTATPPTEAKFVTKMEQPPSEVKKIVREIVDFVALRDQEEPIPFDPDQCKGPTALDEEKSTPPAKTPAQKKTRAGLLCELRRLDVTVFDMDEKEAEALPVVESTSTEENCKKDSCRLGCLCESLAGRRATMPTHCGRVDCMFECSCTSISYERKAGGRHLLDVSDATLAWIQDESERNLAKVERQFKQTVVRAKDDLIVMGSKRSRREIKMPERYRENFITNKDTYLLYEIQKMQRKSSTTVTPPLTPTNKSLSPSKLITPPKAPSNKPTPPQRPKFDDPPEHPRAKVAKIPFTRTISESSNHETEFEDESPAHIRSCSVLLYRMNADEDSPPRRNIALKSTSKRRHLHNILQSSARTSCTYTAIHRMAKKNENKLTSLWNQHSADSEIFCHIVKEHSISPEEWEKSGELAASEEQLSPLKKNANSVQLIPWTFLRDRFRSGEYHIWYKRQQGNNKQKLYLTDGPTKPNKVCVNLRELEDPLCTTLPPMIAKLVTADENPEDDDKDARCFLKSLGDYWMIAGYMQRTVGNATTAMPDNTEIITKMAPSISRTSEDEAVEIDDPQIRSKSRKNQAKAQARWWLLHLTQTFDILLFPSLGVSVTYSQITKTASLANKDQSSGFIRMTLQKNSKNSKNLRNSKNTFGLYGVPGMPDCVLIGPYALDQQPGFKAYSQRFAQKKQYVRVPIYCANKDSEYDVETRRIATPEWLLRVPQRVIGTWLYDFKSLELPRPVSTLDKYPEKRLSDEVPNKKVPYFSAELRSRLEEAPASKSQPQPEPQLPKLPVSAQTHASRPKVRSGQSLLKGNDEVKTINKNTLSVRIDGKAKEALVHVGEINEQAKEESKRGKLKIRQDLMRSSASSPGPVPETRTPSTSSFRKSSTENLVDLEDDVEPVESPQGKEPKKDFIVSNIKNLGYIPVTYVDDTSVFIPHFSVPGQVHYFGSHDEVVKFVYQAVRQKITFIGLRPETISWRQVDSIDDVKGEKQFNPGVLVGNHVITKAGLINLVKLAEEEISTLNLLPKEVEELTAKLDHIKSLPLLRQLGRLLVGPKAGPMPQNAIVFMAVSEIQKLAAQGTVLKNEFKELLEERHKIDERLKQLMNELSEEERLKTQTEIDSIQSDKPVIVLDEDSENEGQAAPAAPKTGFAVSEMVNLSSDDDCEVETIPQRVDLSARVRTTVSKVPSSTITSEAAAIPSISATSTTTVSSTSTSIVTTPPTSQSTITIPSTSISTITVPSTSTSTITMPSTATSTISVPSSSTSPITIPSTSSTSSITAPVIRPSQSLICKFPFSPLKRVNVTVKEDGIVATTSTNTMIQLNQPVRTLTRSSDGSLIKAIKIVDPSSLKKIPPSCQTRVLQARTRTAQSVIRPNLKAAPGVMQQKIPILRTVPRAGISATSEVRPRALLMTRMGATVPMTVVRSKTGEPFVKLVSPNSDKVFITSSIPVVKSTTDLRSTGLKVLHPKVPANQRLSSPSKPNVIRILKPVSSTATGDNSVKVLLSPKKAAEPSVPATPPVTSIAEIDTTELLID